MAAGVYNFTIEQGATFTRVFKYKQANGTPIDLSEATDLRMQIRETMGSTNPVISGSFDLNNGFTINAPEGISEENQITLLISSSITELYTFDQAIYDIELVNQGTTTRLLQGKIKLSKEVTR